MEELLSQHRKESKALDGEKRAAIKKAKTTKGKKAKEEIASVEEEYSAKLKIMEERHQQEITALSCTSTDEGDNPSNGISPTTTTMAAAGDDNGNSKDDDETKAAIERQKKLEKIRIQKELERQQRIQKEKDDAVEIQNIGPTLRDIEIQQIQQQLVPLNFTIQPIVADGNCLYRAIAAQCSKSTNGTSSSTAAATATALTTLTYQEIRAICAQTMLDHQEEFAPFCEYNDDSITNFEQYVQSVQDVSGQYWGGHLEIRAISMALHRPIHIYSASTATTSEPLIIDAATAPSITITDTKNEAYANDNVEPIRLSYHLHYYALGEHYNQIVPIHPE